MSHLLSPIVLGVFRTKNKNAVHKSIARIWIIYDMMIVVVKIKISMDVGRITFSYDTLRMIKDIRAASMSK